MPEQLCLHRYTRGRMRAVTKVPKQFSGAIPFPSCPPLSEFLAPSSPVQNQNIVARRCAFQKALERVVNDITWLMGNPLDIDVANLPTCIFCFQISIYRIDCGLIPRASSATPSTGRYDESTKATRWKRQNSRRVVPRSRPQWIGAR
jgi:hypothetical protein